MAITRLQAVTASQGSGASLPITITNSATTMMVLSATVGTTTINPISTITDSHGNTWTRIVSGQPGVSYGMAGDMWYCQNATAGSNTITVGIPSSADAAIVVVEYSGIAIVGALDQSNVTTSTAVVSPGSISTTATTGQANELVFMATAYYFATNTFGAGTGYGNLAVKTNASGISSIGTEDAIVSSAGVQTATMTYSGAPANEPAVLMIATFRQQLVSPISRVATQDATGTGTNTATATYPATPTQGNLLIAFMTDTIGTDSPSITSSTGWTQINLTGTSGGLYSTFYKVAGASEPRIITLNADSSATATWLAIYEYTGWTGTPTLHTFADGTSATSTSMAIPAITATHTNELFFVGGRTDTSEASITSWTNGFATRNLVGGHLITADSLGTTQATYSTTATLPTSSINMGSMIAFFDQLPTLTLSVDAFTAIPALSYTRGAKTTLPTTNQGLEIPYSATEYTNVSTTNSVYTDETNITGVILHQYKFTNSNNTDGITITWVGKSTINAATRPVSLQIWNKTTSLWEGLATNNATVAGSAITLTGVQSSSLSNYYDTGNVVVARVYQ